MKLIYKKLLIGAILLSGCIDPFEPETLEFDSVLVVGATITNEMKQHEVVLTRSFPFEEEFPSPEVGAQVTVMDNGTPITFVETTPGVYQSNSAFAVLPNRSYSLQITTVDGVQFISSDEELPQITPMDDVFAERIVDDREGDGIAIMVDTFDPTNTSNFYRYEYEETYMVIAPDFVPIDLVPDPDLSIGAMPFEECNVRFEPRDLDERVCFPSDISNSIIQTETSSLNEDRVSRFPVRFISRENFIISHRYSILIRQFVQSSQAFNFFNTLSQFSEEGNLFSQIQPGLVVGNIFSETGDENVLGYFDVTSVSEQRIFFNYVDFYPGEPLPPYIDPCQRNSPPLFRGAVFPVVCVLSPLLEMGFIKFVDENPDPQVTEGPYQVVARVCGDCTVLGTSETPEFWIE